MRTFAQLAMVAALWLVSAWFLMLAVGIAHADWIPALPTIGFETALLLGSLGVARSFVAVVFGEIQKGGKR